MPRESSRGAFCFASTEIPALRVARLEGGESSATPHPKHVGTANEDVLQSGVLTHRPRALRHLL